MSVTSTMPLHAILLVPCTHNKAVCNNPCSGRPTLSGAVMLERCTSASTVSNRSIRGAPAAVHAVLDRVWSNEPFSASGRVSAEQARTHWRRLQQQRSQRPWNGCLKSITPTSGNTADRTSPIKTACRASLLVPPLGHVAHASEAHSHICCTTKAAHVALCCPPQSQLPTQLAVAAHPALLHRSCRMHHGNKVVVRDQSALWQSTHISHCCPARLKTTTAGSACCRAAHSAMAVLPQHHHLQDRPFHACRVHWCSRRRRGPCTQWLNSWSCCI